MIDLRRSGTRIRSGAVIVTHLPASPTTGVPPRVAFAIGRRIGGAVQRNRLRRQLRAAFRQLSAQPTGVPAGAYLVGVQRRAVSSTYSQLTADLARCLAKLGPSDTSEVSLVV
jgi:ribonuclease P protein component